MERHRGGSVSRLRSFLAFVLFNFFPTDKVPVLEHQICIKSLNHSAFTITITINELAPVLAKKNWLCAGTFFFDLLILNRTKSDDWDGKREGTRILCSLQMIS